MATADSPRASIASIPRVQSPASERSSVSLDRQQPSSTAPSQRRNRAALRDYYGLKAAAPANGTDDASEAPQSPEPPSELDKPDFDPQQYITQLLAKESLEGVLRVETGLVSDIKGFDGERKALVYDNYSKLIAATDTIKRMRTNMDPLAPMTSTLEPAVAHIAGMAEDLSKSLSERLGDSGTNGNQRDKSDAETQKVNASKQQTVRWVLDTPRRLKTLVQTGKRDEAETDWAEVDRILDKWSGVKGVEQIREQAKAAMDG